MTIASVDLKADAIAEAERLSQARAIASSGRRCDRRVPDFEGPLVARARGSEVRRALGGRLLMIWRIAYEDSCGRIVESRLVPVLVSVAMRSGVARARGSIRNLLREIDAPLRRFVNNAEPWWRAAAVETTLRFAAARAERERAIARCAARERQLFQPGLFDRRGERKRQRDDDAAADAEREAHARVDAAAAAGRLTPREGELLLVLTP